MDTKEFKLTEEKVAKLKPIIEKLVSRKYGKEIVFNELTIGEVSIRKKADG